MNIITLPLGPLETNCYLVCEDGVCAVIDPGASAQKIFAGMQAAGCRPAAILLTRAARRSHLRPPGGHGRNAQHEPRESHLHRHL